MSNMRVVPAWRVVPVPMEIPLATAAALMLQGYTAHAVVFATVGNVEKADIARRLGADHCILYQETDFSEFLWERTGGHGVNVVYDSVGRVTLERSLRCVRRRGLCVLFGVSSGPVASISPFELAEDGSLFFTRPYLADHLLNAQEVRWRARELFSLLQSGRSKSWSTANSRLGLRRRHIAGSNHDKVMANCSYRLMTD